MLDYTRYISLHQEGKFQEAVDYKCTEIPTTLYKYVGLDDDKRSNELKLNYLEQGKISLSSFGNFNDPFEGKFFRFDKNMLAEKGWNIDRIKQYYESVVRNFKYSCLSGVGEQNMPMWAYYANNHSGFCVEYQLIDKQKKYIYPVTYEPERMPANTIITNLLHELFTLKRLGKTHKEISDEGNVYLQLLFLSLAAKHKSWEHEKEYRIISPFEDFPAYPSKIYIGMNCKEEYKDRLIQIGQKLSWICEVYKLYIDESSKVFDLAVEKMCNISSGIQSSD
ncbi:MAG: DUF2971 domain-containing protein [Lachnospiraceae bacterium]